MHLSLFNILTLVIACTAILWSIAQMIALRRNMNNIILSGFYLSLGMMLLYFAFMTTGILHQNPHLALIHLPFLYMIGPLLNMFLKYLTKENYKFKKTDLIHIIPVILFIILLLPIYTMSAEEKMAIISSPPNVKTASGYLLIYPVSILIIIVNITIYFIQFLKNSAFLWKKNYRKHKNTIIFPYLLTIVVAIILSYGAIGYTLIINNFYPLNYTTYISFIEAYSGLLSVAIIIYFLMLIRYPDYYKQLELYHKEGHDKSRITGIDVDKKMEELILLMENHKIYCDEDLTLNRLSKELSIAPYQLSQIINDSLRKNFSTFINEYRINEAKKMLIEDTKRSITSIAYAVGFNTISVFYKWFYKITGKSPGEIRENIE